MISSLSFSPKPLTKDSKRPPADEGLAGAALGNGDGLVSATGGAEAGGSAASVVEAGAAGGAGAGEVDGGSVAGGSAAGGAGSGGVVAGGSVAGVTGAEGAGGPEALGGAVSAGGADFELTPFPLIPHQARSSRMKTTSPIPPIRMYRWVWLPKP